MVCFFWLFDFLNFRFLVSLQATGFLLKANLNKYQTWCGTFLFRPYIASRNIRKVSYKVVQKISKATLPIVQDMKKPTNEQDKKRRAQQVNGSAMCCTSIVNEIDYIERKSIKMVFNSILEVVLGVCCNLLGRFFCVVSWRVQSLPVNVEGTIQPAFFGNASKKNRTAYHQLFMKLGIQLDVVYENHMYVNENFSRL